MLSFRNKASILMLSALSGFLIMPSHALAKQVQQDTIEQKTESVADIARKKGIDFGFAVNYGQLKNDQSYQNFVKQNATIIVPENTLKWKRIHPKKN